MVSGDFLYDQIAANLVSTAQLPKEVFENVQRFAAGDADAQLKARLLKLIYLINKLPADAAMDIGLKATEDVLADLLVTDLSAGSSELRKKLPALLDELQNKDRLVMALAGGSGTEYRLQTRESSAWYDEFRAQEAELKAAPQRVEQKRADLLKARFGEVLKKVRVVQGKDNVERTPQRRPTTTPCLRTTTRACTCGFRMAGRRKRNPSLPRPRPRAPTTPRCSPSCRRSTRPS